SLGATASAAGHYHGAGTRGACRPPRRAGDTAMEAEPLSVVIATRDRAERLERMLASLDAESEDLLEVVVVDNGSRDDTAQRIERWCEARPYATALHHAPPGKSGALNAGVARTRGAWIAFLDDDVSVRPGWARALRRAAAET